MILVFLLFWVLLIWGLLDGELYAKEALLFGLAWVALLVGAFCFTRQWIWFIVPMVVIDVVLLFKVVGRDIPIH